MDAGCIVGKDYPNRINDHKISSRECNVKMAEFRQKMVDRSEYYQQILGLLTKIKGWYLF